ncbi:MAG: acyl-homoserine-lactone synthase [Acidiferrobacter sp.]
MPDVLRFTECGLIVRVLTSPEDQHQAFQLRHAVYCRALRWVAAHRDGLEKDHYEEGSTSLGAFTTEGELLGLVRMIPANRPFMLEHDFLGLVGPLHKIRKHNDTAEVTRLTTRPGIDGHHKAVPVSCLLYKAIYRWSCMYNVRYLYMVVETRYLRTLRRWGFPCTPIGPARLLGTNTLCVAALLDWDIFRAHIAIRPSPFSAWITDTHQRSPGQPPLLWPGHDSAPPISA